MDAYAGVLHSAAASGELHQSFRRQDVEGRGTVSLAGLRAVLHEHRVTGEFGGQPDQVSGGRAYHPPHSC